MFKLSVNNIVTVSRGDSFECPLFINMGTDVCPLRYVLKDGEYIYFAIERPNQCFENAVFKKQFTNENLNENEDVEIVIDGKDTINLCPGTYYYEIKAKLLDEQGNYFINTIVEKTRFIIL